MPAPRDPTTIVVLAGPTAVGKTRVALELCRRFGGEIVGADSIQVYRGFDIGSNKPSREELSGIPHHLLDVLEPDEPIDAVRFAALADESIAAIAARGAVPFVVGGTGLWLRALLRGLLALPKVDAALRARLMQQWRELGAEKLHQQLREVDPRAASALHPNDAVRVVRALEVYLQTGEPLGALRAAHALGQPRYRALTLVLDLPAEPWRELVKERTRRMLERGWIDEVRSLRERYGKELRPLRSVGYRQIGEGVEQGSSLIEIEQRVLYATYLYGKRQRNWFDTDPSVDLRVAAQATRESSTLAAISEHLSLSHNGS